MDLNLLTDDDLESMRRAPKVIDNPRARWVAKRGLGHHEKNLELHDARDTTQRYRLFLRLSSTKPSAFSVGLRRIWSSEASLLLVRYNGPYHAHGNVLEQTRVELGCHKHFTTERYIRAGLKVDGYAEAATEYNSIESAFECFCREFGVAALNFNPFQPELEY
ncbi:hypothetical protein [Caballeronia pedi]|uniref:hypothetical protein n=1 Tax=Caballeronia pedi TaxID=1777141 RepID=UPI000772C36B|nr:hypothetical protein [Caballeronia pedi]